MCRLSSYKVSVDGRDITPLGWDQEVKTFNEKHTWAGESWETTGASSVDSENDACDTYMRIDVNEEISRVRISDMVMDSNSDYVGFGEIEMFGHYGKCPYSADGPADGTQRVRYTDSSCTAAAETVSVDASDIAECKRKAREFGKMGSTHISSSNAFTFQGTDCNVHIDCTELGTVIQAYTEWVFETGVLLPTLHNPCGSLMYSRDVQESLTLVAEVRTSSESEQVMLFNFRDSVHVSLDQGVARVNWLTTQSSGVSEGFGGGINDGEWHQVAVTYDGATMRVYVDGQLGHSADAGGSILKSGGIFYGCRGGMHKSIYHKSTDEMSTFSAQAIDMRNIRVYDSKLEKAELVALWDGGRKVPHGATRLTSYPEGFVEVYTQKTGASKDGTTGTDMGGFQTFLPDYGPMSNGGMHTASANSLWASTVCRALGYVQGGTWGNTETTPFVSTGYPRPSGQYQGPLWATIGYRTCMGGEDNLFSCPTTEDAGNGKMETVGKVIESSATDTAAGWSDWVWGACEGTCGEPGGRVQIATRNCTGASCDDTITASKTARPCGSCSTALTYTDAPWGFQWKPTSVRCLGNATECTTHTAYTDRRTTDWKACTLDLSADSAAQAATCAVGCNYKAAYTPTETASLLAATCTRQGTDAYSPTCDLDPTTDGSGACPTGCTDPTTTCTGQASAGLDHGTCAQCPHGTEVYSSAISDSDSSYALRCIVPSDQIVESGSRMCSCFGNPRVELTAFDGTVESDIIGTPQTDQFKHLDCGDYTDGSNGGSGVAFSYRTCSRPSHGAVRLTQYPKGRVEIYSTQVAPSYITGRHVVDLSLQMGWGTLCGNDWWDNQIGAANLCVQLGMAYTDGTRYDAGSGRLEQAIVAGHRKCESSERGSTIFDCPLQGGFTTDTETEGCQHGVFTSRGISQDAGVFCTTNDYTGREDSNCDPNLNWGDDCISNVCDYACAPESHTPLCDLDNGTDDSDECPNGCATTGAEGSSEATCSGVADSTIGYGQTQSNTVEECRVASGTTCIGDGTGTDGSYRYFTCAEGYNLDHFDCDIGRNSLALRPAEVLCSWDHSNMVQGTAARGEYVPKHECTAKECCTTAPCVAFSEDACREAALAHGLLLGGAGFSFASADYTSKGCYAYWTGPLIGRAFYGRGTFGSNAPPALPVDNRHFRPPNHDCRLMDTTGRLCSVNEHVHFGVCRQCAAGKQNIAGNNPTGEDTTCVVVECMEDEYVINHACVTCEAGKHNAAGNDSNVAVSPTDAVNGDHHDSIHSNFVVGLDEGDDTQCRNATCDNGSVNPDANDAGARFCTCHVGFVSSIDPTETTTIWEQGSSYPRCVP